MLFMEIYLSNDLQFKSIKIHFQLMEKVKTIGIYAFFQKEILNNKSYLIWITDFLNKLKYSYLLTSGASKKYLNLILQEIPKTFELRNPQKQGPQGPQKLSSLKWLKIKSHTPIRSIFTPVIIFLFKFLVTKP